MRPAFLLCVAGILVLCGCAAYTPSVDHPEKLGPGGSAQDYFRQGEQFYKIRDYDKAIEAFKEALRLRPNHAGTHNALGYAYLWSKTDRLKEAEASFQEAIRLNPGFACPHFGLFHTYLFMGNKQAAMAEFRAGERLDPKSAKEVADRFREWTRKLEELQQKKAAQGKKE